MIYWKKKSFVLKLFILIFFRMTLFALDISINSEISLSSEDAPLWIVANRWGDIMKDKSIQSLSGIRLGHEMSFFNESLVLSMGMDGQIRLNDEPDFTVRAMYGKLFYAHFFLEGGIIRSTLGDTPLPELTSGSMIVSANAPPLPKITFASDGYISVLGTNGNLWVKGGISQGWFTDNRYVDNTLLHEKWAYIQLRRENIFSFHLGLVHEVMWGGEDEYGNSLPVTWDNYWRIFTGRSGGADASESDQLNSAGNSLGIWDIGTTIGFNNFDLDLYKHHFFEDGSGLLRLNNLEDGLWGVGINVNEKGLINSILFEYMNSVHQSGNAHGITLASGETIILGGLDNYYSNSPYKSGWTHYGYSLGTPYFLISGEGDTTRIASNRIRAFMLGFQGLIGNNDYLVRAAYVRHFYPYTLSDADKIITVDGDSISFFHFLFEYTINDLFNTKGLSTIIQVAFDVDEARSINPGMSVLFSYKIP